MALSLDEFLANNPVDTEKVAAYKQQMLHEMREYKLRGCVTSKTHSTIDRCKSEVSEYHILKVENEDIDNSDD